MRTCDACESTKSTMEFTTISPTCLICVHAWWKEYGPGKRKVTGTRIPADELKGRQKNLRFSGAHYRKEEARGE